jgi:hypothetical protein
VQDIFVILYNTNRYLTHCVKSTKYDAQSYTTLVVKLI